MESASRAESVLIGGVSFGCAAVLSAAALAWLAGALHPWVSAVSLVAGAVAAFVAARQAKAASEPWTIWEWLALGAFALVSLRQFLWLVFERDGALLTLLPNNYGDLPLHWTYVQQIASGARFWPENPILTHDTAALSGRRGPADGRRREPRPEPAARAQGDGPLRLAARGARAPALGRGVRGRGLPVLRRPRRRRVAPRRKARGRRRPGGLEEPVPRALRAAARLPARAARRPRAALELAQPPAAERAWTSGLGRGARLGGAAARPPSHVRLRVARLRALDGGERPLARGVRERGPGPAPGHLGRAPGDRGSRNRAARRVGAGLGDRRSERGALPRAELRLLAAARGHRARRRRSRAAARGAAAPGAVARALRAALPGARGALGLGQHQGHALVPGGDAAGARRPRARPPAPGAARGRARAPLRVGLRERAVGLHRAPAAARGAEPGGVRGRVRGPGEDADRARRDAPDLQPSGGALRPAARGGLLRTPLEPRPRRVARSRRGSST